MVILSHSGFRYIREKNPTFYVCLFLYGIFFQYKAILATLNICGLGEPPLLTILATSSG